MSHTTRTTTVVILMAAAAFLVGLGCSHQNATSPVQTDLSDVSTALVVAEAGTPLVLDLVSDLTKRARACSFLDFLGSKQHPRHVQTARRLAKRDAVVRGLISRVLCPRSSPKHGS